MVNHNLTAVVDTRNWAPERRSCMAAYLVGGLFLLWLATATNLTIVTPEQTSETTTEEAPVGGWWVAT